MLVESKMRLHTQINRKEKMEKDKRTAKCAIMSSDVQDKNS